MLPDGSGGTPVFQNLGQTLANHGFSSTAVTVSVDTDQPSDTANSCLSVYGDGAQILGTTELLAATGGALIGQPRWIKANGDMNCDDSINHCPDPALDPTGWLACATFGMFSLPAAQPTRTVTDMHASPCVKLSGGACDTSQDVTTAAVETFNAVASFLLARGLSANTVIFGETWSSSSNLGCDNGTQVQAQQSVNGYLSSGLFSSFAPNVVFRPWEDWISNPSNGCQTPAAIGAPNGPYLR
jgi:hypothetical protein